MFKSLNQKGGLVDRALLFKDLGAEGARAAKIISVMAQNYHQIVQEQQLSNKAFNDGVSVVNEYAVKNNNLQAELEKARKKFQDTRLELGEKLYPILLKLTKSSTLMIKGLASLSSFAAENKSLILLLVAAYGKYLLMLGKAIVLKGKDLVVEKAEAISLAATNVQLDFQTLKLYYNGLAHDVVTKKITLFRAAQEALRITMMKMPWTAIFTAITALGVGI